MTTIIIDDIKLNLADLAHSCSVSQEWIVERVQAGLLCTLSVNAKEASYSSAELTRARRLRNIERSFDANPELAALVVDMMEEIQRLKNGFNPSNVDSTDL